MALLKVVMTSHVEHYTLGLVGGLEGKADVTIVAEKSQSPLLRSRLPRARVAAYYSTRHFRLVSRSLGAAFLGVRPGSVIHFNGALEAYLGGLLRGYDRILVVEHGFPLPLLAPESRRFYERELASLRFLHEVGVPVVTISEFSARMLRGLGVKPSRVIRHGVLRGFFYRPRELGRGEKTVLWCSRFVTAKEPFTLLRAVASLKKKGVGGFRVILRGDGPLRGAVEAFVAKNGLTGVVEFVGRVPFEKLPALYRSADIFVHTARFEPFGLAVLEAMASGLPVVVPRFGGAAEVAGRAGVFFEPGDHEGLAERVLELLHDENSYARYSRLSLERAGEFSWERAAAEYLSVYSKLLR